MTRSTPHRPRRRWIIATASVIGGLVVLGVAGELVLRGIIDDQIETTESELPAGVTVERDDTPALWQVATGQATVSVRVSPEALTDTARTATDLPELQVAVESGNLVAQVPLSIAGNEQTVDVLLSVAAEGGQAVLRADTVQFAGLSLPVAVLADQLDNADLDRLAEGVAFPEGQDDVTISSARTTDDGLELGAEVTMW
ncbi:hypothetical protein [Promicromonospora iranensis]|uniref:DUF2993 family protein n=1 Tax=Promicromonospora iranensis TaxID=1105144 RepID=A0ABU2CKL8_9MICO|nr:hypothetical protein [Promicromonospora iranensis]MDR7381864.1 hypothetical protein [Promicromonospora iranensis]